VRVRFVFVLVLLALLVATIWALAAAALSAAQGATKPTRRPAPTVDASTVTQTAEQVTWTVELAARFSPAGLRHDGRSVCLLLERPKNGSVGAEMCIAPPVRAGASPRLLFAHITAAGPGHFVNTGATITRGSPRELTATFDPTNFGLPYSSFRWQVISRQGPPSCVPDAGAKCFIVFPARPALAKLHVPQLVGCVPSGPSLVFDGPSNAHDIALTFDDGPGPQPPSIDFVDLLAHYHVPATFFEIGDQISEYDSTGAVERQMLADGDMIGDHTWTHPDMVNLSPGAQASELELTARAIRRATGFTPCLWRPPYEAFDSQVDSLARSLGFLTINYDVDTVDWSLPGTATIYQRAVSGAHNGAIILQHFGGGPRYETLAALPGEITTLRREGYQFVNIATLLGLELIYK
jgi:peptidoglycan-N-acetylglucosamine deacetylase